MKVPRWGGGRRPEGEPFPLRNNGRRIRAPGGEEAAGRRGNPSPSEVQVSRSEPGLEQRQRVRRLHPCTCAARRASNWCTPQVRHRGGRSASTARSRQVPQMFLQCTQGVGGEHVKVPRWGGGRRPEGEPFPLRNNGRRIRASRAKRARPVSKLRKAPPHAGDRYRCSLPGLAGFTGQRWRDHKFGCGMPTAKTSVKRHHPGRAGDTSSGERGIRTLGTVSSTHDFQSCTFDHSVTSPIHVRPWVPQRNWSGRTRSLNDKEKGARERNTWRRTRDSNPWYRCQYT